MQKRGQINAYFVYAVLVLLIVSVTVLFGFSQTNDITQTASKAEVLSLKSTIANDVAIIGDDYGSVSVKNYRVPEKVSQICFVDNKNKRLSAGLAAFYPMIKEGVEENNNMFLIYDNGLVDSYDVGDIEVLGPESICYPKEGGIVKVTYKGKGDKAQINEDFSEEISPNQEKSFDFAGISILNNGINPVSATIRFSASGLSDEITILPSGEGSVTLTMQIPRGFDCSDLYLEYSGGTFLPECVLAREGKVSFNIQTT